MINVRMARVKTVPEARPRTMDEQFVNGAIAEFPRVGQTFVMYFDKLDKGWWRTTIIKKIEWDGNLVKFETNNSVYLLKSGWVDGKEPVEKREFQGEINA